MGFARFILLTLPNLMDKFWALFETGTTGGNYLMLSGVDWHAVPILFVFLIIINKITINWRELKTQLL